MAQSEAVNLKIPVFWCTGESLDYLNILARTSSHW